MRILTFIVGLLVFFSIGCQKETPTPPTQIIKDGVIVMQKPLWRVPYDTANYIVTIVKPYFQFKDKVIVESYKNKKGGLRCMKVETGEIVWEKYFNTSADYAGEQSFILRRALFRPDEGYLIVMVGAWGERRHVKLDIETGETVWEVSLETFPSIELSGNFYYTLVSTDDDVCPIYKVDISCGVAQYFYSTPLAAHPNFDWPRFGYALPFSYAGKEFIFIAETRLSKPDSAEHFASLLDVETMTLLLKHKPLDGELKKVEVFNNNIYLFTGEGYKIFNMETLTFEREVKLIGQGQYWYHTFYKDKLVIGLTPTNGADHNGHYVVDINNHTLKFYIEHNIYPCAILDDVLYFATAASSFQAHNLNTGKKVLDFNLRWETQFGVATYKNAKGKKFVVVGDKGYTYCFEGV